jgi:hypothetical protein
MTGDLWDHHYPMGLTISIEEALAEVEAAVHTV